MLGWGTAPATIAWLAATAGFSLYVAKFHVFDRTYGSIGGVVVLLVWLYLTAFVVLIGGEINARQIAIASLKRQETVVVVTVAAEAARDQTA
jgi:YihY family inner membrane protein